MKYLQKEWNSNKLKVVATEVKILYSQISDYQNILYISIVKKIINKGKTNKSYDYGKNIYYYQLWQD